MQMNIKLLNVEVFAVFMKTSIVIFSLLALLLVILFFPFHLLFALRVRTLTH